MSFLKGDVNHDQQIGLVDIQMVLRNLGKPSSLLTNYFDPMGDGKINIMDTVYVIRDWAQ